MKFKYWALSLLACGGMLSCTNEDVVDSSNGKGETSTSYLAVNVLNAGAPGTRVGTDGGYDEGEGNESVIDNVRFYLFDSFGNPFNGFTDNAGTPVNYTDVVPSFSDPNSGTEGDNVEKVSESVLVISAPKGQVPSTMVAVINSKVTPSPMNLKNLKEYVANLGSTSEGEFVMSNSTYLSGSEVTCENKLTTANFKTTAEDAKAAPVDVYVERVVAKVLPKITMQSTQLTKGTGYLVYNDADDSKDVYVKIKGWAIADANGKSYLCKQLSSSYENLGITGLSDASAFRSFWANSVQYGSGNDKVNQSWTNISANLDGNTPLYTQEYTPTAIVTDKMNNNDLTKLIVAATLCNKDGDAITRITHRGITYTDQNALISQIVQYQKTESGTPYYVKDGDTYRYIDYRDVDVLTANGLTDKSGVDSYKDSYRVYLQLKTKPADVKLYSDDKGTAANNETAFNTALRGVENSMMIWNGGMTYYYIPISHLGTANTLGQYGVVRNHVYQVNITDIQGFGTPVYDAGETIVPVTPDDELAYLAAKINVLSWKIVSSDVTLGQ